MKIEDLSGITGASIRVQIKEETEQGQYNDSLYYTLEELENLELSDIEDHKRSRVDNWVAFVTEASKPKPEPTEEELQSQIDSMQEQMDRIQEQMDTTTNILLVKQGKVPILPKKLG